MWGRLASVRVQRPCFMRLTRERSRSARGGSSARFFGVLRRLFFVVLLVLGVSCRPRAGAEEDRRAEVSAASLATELAGVLPETARPTGIVRQFSVVAAETTTSLGDGPPVRVWAYNGSVPGPVLRVKLGDTVRVAFENRLPQPTTIHWHGVRVPNAMDGVPHATQPPIPPGGTFVYEFTPKDPGTFWFHPHIRASEQVERGLYGVLIVEDVEPSPYARDVTWVVDDWLLDERGQVYDKFDTPHDLAHDGRWGSVITVNGTTKTTLALRSGERVRLRILNTSNGRVYKLDLGRLIAHVIAFDGTYLREPMSPAGLELAPGNRMDLDVSVESTSSERFAIYDRFVAGRPNRLADVVVDDVAPPAPAFASPAHARVPHWSGALALPVSHELRLNARRGGEKGIEWTINERAFAGHEHDHTTAFSLSRGKWHRLRFTNESYRLHPIHTHGMFFRVLARNDVPVDEPFFRDTVLVHGKETVDIGVVPLDAGNWMLHCHVLEHAEAGMMTMMSVD